MPRPRDAARTGVSIRSRGSDSRRHHDRLIAHARRGFWHGAMWISAGNFEADGMQPLDSWLGRNDPSSFNPRTTLDVGAGDGIDVSSTAVSVDVTELLGSGLTGLSSNLAVDFADPGSAMTTSRSDHTHGGYAIVYENALATGANTEVLNCDDNDDGILITWGTETQDRGVVWGQYANALFSGIRVDDAGNVPAFSLSSSGNILDTGIGRLHHQGASPRKVILHNDGGDWLDHVYFMREDSSRGFRVAPGTARAPGHRPPTRTTANLDESREPTRLRACTQPVNPRRITSGDPPRSTVRATHHPVATRPRVIARTRESPLRGVHQRRSVAPVW